MAPGASGKPPCGCMVGEGCVVLGLLPVTASAAKGSCGDNLNWNLDESTGVLTISGTGPMY